MIREDNPVRPRLDTERIVVAADGGAGSRAALRWVADHLRSEPSQVALVRVADEGAPEDDDQADLRAAVLVIETLNEGAQAHGQLRRGNPVDELVAAATELEADLLVIGTHASPGHRQSPRATLPGRLAARADCVVIVVPQVWTPSPGPIVVGNSIDSASDPAVDFAHATAAREHRDLVIAHVWELPTVGETAPTPGGGESIPERQQAALDGVVRELAARTPLVRVTGDLRRGPAARGLAAAGRDAALLVVGRRRLPAVARILLGSTSRELVAAPPCPVAIVPGPGSGLRIAPDVEHEDL